MMPQWLSDLFEKSHYFMPHGHCYLWLPGLLWLHVTSDLLIGAAYLGISVVLYLLVRKIRLPFSPIFVAFGLFIGLCGLTHFMSVWVIWNPDYLLDGLVKAGTAAASVATALGLLYVKPGVELMADAARLSEERGKQLARAHAELEAVYAQVKQLDEVKSQFFANVSHELRTPLTLILGPLETLLADPSLTPGQRRQLQSMQRNGRSLLGHVNDLLDVAKLEVGQMSPRYAELDVAAWTRQVAARFDLAAEQRQLRYQLALPDQLTAQTDPEMLERVLVNLLANAFKFTPAGGEVRVALHADGAGEDGHFVLAVADTGPGIRPDQQTLIFERFRQADGSPTRLHGGTGLGLSIARDFVALQGGRIEVASTPGAGACFTVRLPLRAPAGADLHPFAGLAAAAPGVPPAPAPEAWDSPRPELPAQPEPAGLPGPEAAAATVLLVEDNRDMRDFVTDTLGVDCRVETAPDGQEALDSLERRRHAGLPPPDLIITDLMMPRLSGDQLVRAVRARDELAHVPVLLLTAKADEELKVRLLREGAQDYLPKPFLPQELRARTANLIAMKRASDALREELEGASGSVDELARTLAVKHQQLQGALDAMAVARDQAERASQIKSQFLSLVSHELRTPLSTIQMNAQLLDRHPGNVDAAFLRPRLDRLIRASQQMTTLIDGLLEYARAEAGRIHTHPQALDPLALAQEVVRTHAETAGQGVRLQVEALPDQGKPLPPLVSDARLLRVVLDNLVINALKFTQEGTVSVRVAAGEDGRSHVFEVQDTGIGMAASDLPRIFLPFEQLEPIRSKSTPGVGLGLALVKNIVHALGGHIEVTSELGRGSTFTVTLPAHPPSSAAQARASSTAMKPARVAGVSQTDFRSA